ncbi:MAG: hypothetical protein V3U76_03935 [Granulosicoccus sp.]
MTELDKRLRRYYQQTKLSAENIEEFLAAGDAAQKKSDSLAEATRSVADKRDLLEQEATAAAIQTSNSTDAGVGASGQRWTIIRLATAAVLILSLGVFMRLYGSHVERTERTLREVAMNHATRLQLEFHGESLASLDDNMQLLPFSLVLPDRLYEGYDIIGSRYCSLSGNLAAHLKFRESESGRSVSLFVTFLADDLKRIQSERADLDGIGVELWQEGGLFYALAQQS